MTTITRERLLKIQQWRETYGSGSNVVLPAEEAEELARIALASLTAEPVGTFRKGPCGYSPSFHEDAVPLYTAPPAPVVPDEMTFEAVSYPHNFDCNTQYAYQQGWNACRAAMLQDSQPVSNRDELPVSEIECDICGFKSTDPDGAHYCCEDNSND